MMEVGLQPGPVWPSDPFLKKEAWIPNEVREQSLWVSEQMDMMCKG